MLKSLNQAGKLCKPCLESLQGNFYNIILPSVSKFNLQQNLQAPENLQDWNDFNKKQCRCCLGIFDLIVQENFNQAIVNYVESSQYDFENFELNFKLPLTLKLRQQYLLDNLSEQELEFCREFDLKAQIKEFLNQVFFKYFNKEISTKNSLCITLNFSNKKDEQQIYSLFKDQVYSEKIVLKQKIKKKRKNRDNKQQNILTVSSLNYIDTFLKDQISDIIQEEMLDEQFENTNFKIELRSESIFLMDFQVKHHGKQMVIKLQVNKFQHSVSEIISKPILEYFQPQEDKFHSGGREDIDVRMLGNGRPFVIELISPKKRFGLNQEVIQDLQKKVNQQHQNNNPETQIFSMVQIKDLQIVNNDCFKQLSSAAKDKCKIYCCLIVSDQKIKKDDPKIKKINLLQNIKVLQKTPLRVLHRRVPLTREKIIHRIYLHPINEQQFICFLMTSAGAYVKEFIHSDLKRTSPSVGELLECNTDIVQLDVLYLCKEFNKESSNKFNEIVKEYVNQFNKQYNELYV